MVDAPSAPASGPGQDPTPRTIEALYREIAALKEIVSSEIRSTKETIATRNIGYDKAIELLQAKADSQPTPAIVQSDIKALRDLTKVQFDGVDKQISNLLTNIAEATTTSKTAIDAAFAAADKAVERSQAASDKAVEKSQKNTEDQLKTIKDFSQNTISTLKDQVAQVDNRLGILQEWRANTTNNSHTQKTDQQTSHVNTMGYVAIAISIGLAIALPYFKPAPPVVERIQIEQPAIR